MIIKDIYMMSDEQKTLLNYMQATSSSTALPYKRPDQVYKLYYMDTYCNGSYDLSFLHFQVYMCMFVYFNEFLRY